MLIEGYADESRLSVARTEQLSRARAEAVKDYLVEHGVPASQIKTAGMADTAARASHRVELVVLSR